MIVLCSCVCFFLETSNPQPPIPNPPNPQPMSFFSHFALAAALFMCGKVFLVKYTLAIMSMCAFDTRSLDTVAPNTVLAVYGHTSYCDSVVNLVQCLFMNMTGRCTITGLANAKYAWLYPNELQQCLTLTGRSTGISTAKFDSDFLFVFVEGTKARKDYIRSGFFHIALANNSNVAFVCCDYANKKYHLSDFLTSSEVRKIKDDKNEGILLAKIRGMVDQYGLENIAVEPRNACEIRFRGV
jgi:hypothetical protein